MTRSRDTANIIPTVDAKGDLIVGSADNTVAKLAVGAEGTVLLVDPSTPTGLAWGEAGGSISVSTTAPEDPSEGDLWFNSANATTYIYYDSFWVEVSEAKLGPTGLPGVVIQDGQPTDSNVLWLDTDEESLAPVPAGGTAGQILQKTSSNDYETAWVNPPSANAIINGAFEINQRRFTSTTSSGVFTYDRFATNFAGDGTSTASAQTLTPGTLTVPDFGDALNYVRLVTTGQSSSSVRSSIKADIENVQTFAGQTVTLSFWARAGSGTPKIYSEINQLFGTGGSSAVIVSGQQVTLSTSWERYSITFIMPSLSGKTVGAGSYIAPTMWVSAGSDFNSRTNSLGIQSNTFDIWGVQLEPGSTATPFKRNANNIQGELAACQRYFLHVGNGANSALGMAANESSSLVYLVVNHPVEMRTAPTLVQTTGTNFYTLNSINYSQFTATDQSRSRISELYISTSGLTVGRAGIARCLNTLASISLSAEL
jgi:hypothetical protein